jgi:hypothetical protein
MKLLLLVDERTGATEPMAKFVRIVTVPGSARENSVSADFAGIIDRSAWVKEFLESGRREAVALQC